MAETPLWLLLERIEERSAALRAASASAGVAARVPACPDWSVADLIAHLGGTQRFWAASVAAGTPGRPPAEDALRDREPPCDSDALPAWSAASTRVLLDALRAAGPDAVCWTWWAAAGGPSTAWAVARRQAQEAAVLARDAQEAAGAPEPVPADVALDAVDEFLHVCLGSVDGWPHAPARVTIAADEGRAWTLILDATGASAVRVDPGSGPQAGATLAGAAGDLLLGLHRRLPLRGGSLRMSGDAELIRQLALWSPLR